MKSFNKIELLKRQSWPLDRKISESIKRIKEWYQAFDGMVYVSFSGGLDSTVLLNIVRSVYPEVPAVFCNTGLEYPENVLLTKKYENVITIRPKMPFHKVIEKWGYPVISKRTAQYIHEVKNAKGETATKRLRLTGLRTDGTYSKMSAIPNKWQYLTNAPFKISDKCCNELKKKPMDSFFKKHGRYPILGTNASESEQREQTYYIYGCNRYDIKRPSSNPLSFWTNSDIRDYIKAFNVEYSKLYDMGHTRSGCMFCMFGIHLENRRGTNRFILMKDSHPKHWDYCINRLGIGRVLDYIGIPYENKQLKLFPDF